MTALLAGVIGLALLDALNPATIVAVALILLAPFRAPTVTAAWFIAGVYATIVAAGLLVLGGADLLGSRMEDGILLVRRGALVIAALVLAVTGLRRLRPAVEQPVVIPDWLSPPRAALLGLATTVVDLPNAFPYVIAIERLIDAGVEDLTAAGVIAVYGLIYCLPCIALVILWRLPGAPIQRRLAPHIERFRAGGPRPAQPGRAAVYLLGATVVAIIAVVL